MAGPGNTVNLVLGGALTLLLKPAPVGECIVTSRFEGFDITARGWTMAYKLPSGKQIEVEISYTDEAGNPAEIDGEVTWASSNAATATVTPSGADSALATIAAVGPVGQLQINATVDADLGSGTRELVTLFDVEVVAGEAVTGTIAPVGEPVDIP